MLITILNEDFHYLLGSKGSNNCLLCGSNGNKLNTRSKNDRFRVKNNKNKEHLSILNA